MRRQGVSFSSLHTPSSLNVSGSPHHGSPDPSILRSATRSADKSADRYTSGLGSVWGLVHPANVNAFFASFRNVSFKDS